MTDDQESIKGQELSEQPWIVLKTSYDVEAWINNYNWELQRSIKKTNDTGFGICFRLNEGGDIFLHTTSEGDVLLDVTPDAAWVTPVIAAATHTDPPSGQIWALPSHTLTQLILGLSSLIASTRIVLNHDFRKRRY